MTSRRVITSGIPTALIEWHAIPLMLLARLAIVTSWQGKGLGSGLLKDAMLRTLQAAAIAGMRAMAVHAKDDDARAFYERFGFVSAPTDPYPCSSC